MAFDIIYVNFRSTDFLLRSLHSLLPSGRSQPSLKVFVVDNASSDAPDRLTALFPDVILIRNKTNRGFGAAVNQALEKGAAEHVIFLNPDSSVSEGFLETSLTFMGRNPQVGIMGPKIVDEDGTVQGSARSFPNGLTALFGRKSPLTRYFPGNSISRANILNLEDCSRPMAVDWVSGACMVCRREALHAVKGFDERFFLYWEDADLCRRIREKGWKVVYSPEPVVTHLVGKSSRTRPLFANYHFHKSSHLLYEKYAVYPYSLLSPLVGMTLMLRLVFVAGVGAFTLSPRHHARQGTRYRQNRQALAAGSQCLTLAKHGKDINA